MSWLFACHCSDPVVPANSPEALRYAEAVCVGLDRCGCPERFESAGACVEVMAERFDSLRRGGFEFKESCLDEKLASFEAVGCVRGEPETLGECVVFRRPGAAGDRCAQHFEAPLLGVTDCADGLYCTVDGHCDAPGYIPRAKRLGDPCRSDAWPLCDASLVCSDDTDRCEPTRALGEACSSGFECPLGAYCRGDAAGAAGSCQPQLALGQSCDPLDYAPCALAEGFGGAFRWCDPGSGRCSEAPVSFCNTFTHPWVRP